MPSASLRSAAVFAVFVSAALNFAATVLAVGPFSVYVTFHGGSTGVNTVNGYGIGGGKAPAPLVSASDAAGLRELRQLIHLPGALSPVLIANAYKKDSRLVLASHGESQAACDTASDVKTASRDSSLAHPYGLALDATNSRIFVTCQDNDGVLVGPLPRARGSEISFQTFATVPQPRGVAVSVDGSVFVASSTANFVAKFDGSSGAVLAKTFVNHPIAISLAPGSGDVLIGSVGPPSQILRFSSDSLSPLGANLTSTDLSHPSGMAFVSESELLVLSQDNKSLIYFNTTSGSSEVVLNNLPDSPEGLLPVRC